MCVCVCTISVNIESVKKKNKHVCTYQEKKHSMLYSTEGVTLVGGPSGVCCGQPPARVGKGPFQRHCRSGGSICGCADTGGESAGKVSCLGLRGASVSPAVSWAPLRSPSGVPRVEGAPCTGEQAALPLWPQLRSLPRPVGNSAKNCPCAEQTLSLFLCHCSLVGGEANAHPVVSCPEY